jgi:hypothetical protein
MSHQSFTIKYSNKLRDIPNFTEKKNLKCAFLQSKSKYDIFEEQMKIWEYKARRKFNIQCFYIIINAMQSLFYIIENDGTKFCARDTHPSPPGVIYI